MEVIEAEIVTEAETQITMGLLEHISIVMERGKEGEPEDTARRFLTWGNLQQATPQIVNQEQQDRRIH